MKKIYLWALAVLSVIGLSTGVVKALNYSEILNQPSVLGESAYTTQILTSANNASIKISVTPQSYDSTTGFWSYKVAWSRVKNLAGSVYINNQAINSNVSQKGEEIVKVLPGVKNKLEFYSKPNKKGILLVRKYFTSLATPKTEPVACTMEARLCPDGVNYVSRTGPNCEFAACPTTTKPLCPKGLIYMPSCSGVPVQNPDTCEITCTTEGTCQNLWWHDNSNTTCSQQKFCGAYMYQTLKTFGSEAACKADLLVMPKILSITPASAYAGQTVQIKGSGFLPSGNKVVATLAGADVVLGEYNSTDGTAIVFTVPTVLSSSTSLALGSYKISVKNTNGQSNVVDFTVSRRFYAICDYAAPPAGCSYTPGPNYDSQSQCGMVLVCKTNTCERMTSVMPHCGNVDAVFNSSTCQYECPVFQ